MNDKELESLLMEGGLEESFDDDLIELQNLQELQFLMTSMSDGYLTCFYTFFSICSDSTKKKAKCRNTSAITCKRIRLRRCLLCGSIHHYGGQ